MRRLSLPVALIGLLVLSSCATTEQTAETGSSDTEPETEVAIPAWFDMSVTSRADSLSFTGYAHAVSAGRDEAETLAENSASVNLKFEIDRFAEEVRRELSEGASGGTYSSPAFIRNLRNAVQRISTEGAQTETEFFEREGVVHAYTRMSLSKSEIADRLSDRLNHESFITELRRQL